MSLLARVDAAARKRSRLLFWTFRGIAGFLLALGVFGWLGIWFQRDFWLGVAQSVLIALGLGYELKILPGSRAGRLRDGHHS